MRILRVYVLPGIILVSLVVGICMAANAILIPHGYTLTRIGSSAPKLELVTDGNAKVIGYRKQKEWKRGPTYSSMIDREGRVRWRKLGDDDWGEPGDEPWDDDGDEEEKRPIHYISTLWKMSGVCLIGFFVAT